MDFIIYPVAFGERSLKQRIKNVLSYHKPHLWITIVALVLVAVVSACFLTNPKSDEAPAQDTPSQTQTTTGQSDSTKPNATEPTVTEPTTTVPPVTEPYTTEPEFIPTTNVPQTPRETMTPWLGIGIVAAIVMAGGGIGFLFLKRKFRF